MSERENDLFDFYVWREMVPSLESESDRIFSLSGRSVCDDDKKSGLTVQETDLISDSLIHKMSEIPVVGFHQ